MTSSVFPRVVASGTISFFEILCYSNLKNRVSICSAQTHSEDIGQTKQAHREFIGSYIVLGKNNGKWNWTLSGMYSKISLQLMETTGSQKSVTVNACSLVSPCSGMDIFPTLLSLADITAPADRHYDGYDATNVLLHGEQTGREVVTQQIHFPTTSF